MTIGPPIKEVSTREMMRANKFLVACLNQQGMLMVYKIDLGAKQQQLLHKLQMTHKTNHELKEKILSFDFHSGSQSYIFCLTDQGNLHYYHLYPEDRSHNSYKGTISLARGALSFSQDSTGLYFAVLSPLVKQMTHQMCQQMESEAQ